MFNNNLKSTYCGIDISGYRQLKDSEHKILIRNGNKAQFWDKFFVHDFFDPHYVSQCSFFGEIFIGALKEGFIEHEGFSLPIGLYNSTFTNCSIGHFSAINQLHYCFNCDIGSEVIIHNTGDITSDLNARFGNGSIPADGDPKQYRWIYLVNEKGGRKILPFDIMNCSDAYIWVKYPHDSQLIKRLKEITDHSCSDKIRCRGLIGHEALVKNVKSINNSRIENNAVIDCTESIYNCTLHSDDLQPTKAGSGTILVDSIIGFGNRIESGSQVESVITGNDVNISHVSRISHSFIADNSTIACCEIAHSLICPSHEQHHNNSILIAAFIGGQSKISAGTTFGSNQNIKTNNGEIWASRGFCPGICSSFKHSSRFASYTMCEKGDYPHELDIPFPFSFIINDCSNNSLLIYPAYCFSNNMYSFMHSKYKFTTRDKRIHKEQIIEHDPFAPDTIEEMFSALTILESTAGEIWFNESQKVPASNNEYQSKGKELFLDNNYDPEHFKLLKSNIENGNRPILIKKPAQAWRIYRDMICFYAVKKLSDYPQVEKVNLEHFASLTRNRFWINCGGQILSRSDFESILNRIKSDNSVSTWKDIHQLFIDCNENYEMQKIHHAASCLIALMPEETYSDKQYKLLLQKAIDICSWVLESAKSIRTNDYSNHFSTMVYDSTEELQRVLGKVEDDETLEEIRNEVDNLIYKITEISNRL